MPAQTGDLSALLGRLEFFARPPADWFVVVSDVLGSTKAVQVGQYRAINILAASTVILGLNLGRQQGVELPFVYGGDGATLLAPPELLSPLMRALEALRASARRRFGLNLRIGALPLKHIFEAGEDIRVARLRLANGYDQAVFLDGGLAYAERVIKDTYILQDHHRARQRDLNLTGLACRWNEVAPPAGKEELLCLIVRPNNPAQHFAVYRQVLAALERIYGNFNERRPVGGEALSYSTDWRLIGHENYLRFGTLGWFYNFYHFVQAWLARLAGGTKAPTQTLALATDNLKIDGTLKTIIAGSSVMRRQLLTWLTAAEEGGELTFGYHVAARGTITCFVHQASDEYINFIDGAGGGYTQAAKMLKGKKGAII